VAKLRIGLISDTHGLLRPQAVTALHGSDYIIHAGDIGDAAIIEALSEIAPVTAVRGNNDRDRWADAIPERTELEVTGLRILVVHSLEQLGRGFDASGLAAIISGHSHRPRKDTRDGVLYVNPGSAGPRRFSLPVSVGELRIDEGRALAARLITLDAL
jgi:putative phosphoesterase